MAICILILIQSVSFSFVHVVRFRSRFTLVHESNGKGPKSLCCHMYLRLVHIVHNTYSLNYHCRILGFAQLHTPRRILIGMRNTLPTAYPFALTNTTRRMCQLKDTCARDMKMTRFDTRHDFGQICCSKPLLRIRREKSRLQVLWRIIAVRASIFRRTRC